MAPEVAWGCLGVGLKVRNDFLSFIRHHHPALCLPFTFAVEKSDHLMLLLFSYFVCSIVFLEARRAFSYPRRGVQLECICSHLFCLYPVHFSNLKNWLVLNYLACSDFSCVLFPFCSLLLLSYWMWLFFFILPLLFCICIFFFKVERASNFTFCLISLKWFLLLYFWFLRIRND